MCSFVAVEATAIVMHWSPLLWLGGIADAVRIHPCRAPRSFWRSGARSRTPKVQPRYLDRARYG
jgi:hypothetical protein